MKYLRVSTYAWLLLLANYAHAGELPEALLREGDNHIALTIVNRGNADLVSLSVEMAKGALPNWLTIRSADRRLSVPRGERSQEKILLNFIVEGAPPGAEATAPLIIKDTLGNRWTHAVAVKTTGEGARRTFLDENYPNPFNPATNIRYSLSEGQHTTLAIYNSLGQKVRTLVNAPRPAGVHVVRWDGRNDNGQAVSSGVYFYRMTSGSFVRTRQMTLVE